MPEPITGITKVAFLDEYRCFLKGDEFELRPGLNLLVGDQGVGKSSMLTLLSHLGEHGKTVEVTCTDIVAFRSFDFEKDNPRLGPPGGSRGTINYAAQLQMMWSSHGESHRALLFDTEKVVREVILLDEPDTSLSIRSCHDLCRLFDTLVENGCQVIASAHNPIPISHAKQVLSLEHRRWMDSQEFIKAMGKPRKKPRKKSKETITKRGESVT